MKLVSGWGVWSVASLMPLLICGCQSTSDYFSYTPRNTNTVRDISIPILPPRKPESVGKRRAYFGIHANTCINLAGEEGAYVVGFYRNSPAQQKGIAVGDKIIQFGNKPIKNSGDLTIAIKLFPPDDAAAITFIRNRKQFSDVYVIGYGYPKGNNPCIIDSIDRPDDISLCKSIGLSEPLRQVVKWEPPQGCGKR